MSSRSHVIILHSFNGGSGKTSLAINLAYFLSQKRSVKTLLVDGDLAAPTFQKIFPPKLTSDTLMTWVDLLQISSDSITSIELEKYIFPTKFIHLDVMYSPSPQLGKTFLSNKNTSWWTEALKSAFISRHILINELNYEFVIIDNQSGIMMNSVNNLTLGNIVLLVLRPIAFGIDGTEEMVKDIYKTVKNVTKHLWEQKNYLILNQIPYYSNQEGMNTEIDALIEKWIEMFMKEDILTIAKIPYYNDYTVDMLKIPDNKIFGITDFMQKKIEEIFLKLKT